MANIIKVEEIVSRNIEHYLRVENVPGGLLEDVEQIYASNTIDGTLDTPVVWIYEHPTIPHKLAGLEKQQYVITPFEFICIDYDDDLVTAQRKAKNLATRVCASILKNKNLKLEETDPNRLFNNIEFKALYPSGEATVTGHNKKVPCASLRLEFLHIIDWMKCCKKD